MIALLGVIGFDLVFVALLTDSLKFWRGCG